MTAAEDAARRYIREGKAPVPIPYMAKGPVIDEWEKLRITEADLPEHFNGHPQNIGIILGEASKGLTDADLDCKEARQLAKYLLPPTGSIFGRKSAPRSHWEYVVNPPMRTKQWKAPDDKTARGENDKLMLLELRGTDVQTVYPPSTHPSGEPIHFYEDGEAAVVEQTTLVRAASRLAAACLLVRYYPGKGVRHNWALALAGGLLRGGWTEDETTNFMHAVLIVAESENPSLHLATVRDTAKNLEEGKQEITGWPTLKELLGERVVAKVRKWCGCEADDGEVAADVVSELNAKHAVVLIGGRCAILTEVEDARRKTKTITLSRQNDFTLFYKNRFIRAGKKRVDLGTYWIGHSARRQYAKVVFAPDGCATGEYNLYRGFAVVPKEGNCELYLEHTRNVICRGNETHYRWVLAWMAAIAQHPCIRFGTTIVMRGPEGVGKGIEAKWFGGLFGQHFIHLTQSRHLVGNFNAHLREALVVFVDEAFWAGDKSSEGVLKALITEEQHMVESKFFDPIQVDNYTHFLISSNNDWVVPAGPTARRFAVFDVSDRYRGDIEYFNKIEVQMENGGMAALLHYLLHYDYSGVNLRSVPQTDALIDQKDLSMTPVQRFWKNCLMHGSNTGLWHPWWNTSIECRDLHKLYSKEVENLGVRHRANETELGTQLKKLVPGLRKARRWVDQEHLAAPTSKRRSYVWDLPDLETCRRAFDAVMNCQHDWSLDEDEPEPIAGKP